LGLELAAFSHEPARLAWSFVSDGGITKSGMLVRNHDGKNLAGLWDFAVTERAMAQPPAAYQGKIMAPFPIESALSGIKRSLARHEKLWYRLAVEVPWGTDWLKGQNARLMLRFGGVSGTADVFVNGKMRGSHQGSDDGFSFDMTDLITAKDKHTLEIVVAATPADTSPGIQATGICKPAWIEVVRTSHIEALTFVPDVDASIVRVEFAPDGTIHPADPRLQ
jgi:beta-galactosidase/beta-glucuronidase